MHRPSLPRLRSALVLAFVAVLALSACSRREEAPTAPSAGAGASAAGSPAAELRLGYFPNITHAPALIGVANGYFQQELGSTKLTTQTFNAGPGEAVSALLGGSLDASFIGSSPAINAFAKSQRRGGPADRRVDLRRRTARGRPRHHLAGPAQGQDHRDAAGRQHPGRRAQEVAQGEQPHERHGPGRRDRPEHRQPAHARPVQVRARSRAAGCPSRGARGWSTPARRCSSTRRPCGRTASSRPPC